ncbi:ATP-binding cassette domain-containing protein [uncultured Shimia sp.]|uniref:ATP-binding cassette domain-containing protein n=1 Tax=uncultured Shimia sp. TaxID=573152 RepID=UPI0026035859|nr:ATP-binding cassette domain-containing protein [uncultured Shimia sp.]
MTKPTYAPPTAGSALGPTGAPLHEITRLIAPLLVLSAVSNLAILVSPIFMMQVLDRVLPTGNLQTLLLLLSIAAMALLLQAFVDGLRDITLQRTARWCERFCAPIVLAQPLSHRQPLLARVNDINTALEGPAARAALSLPWLPVFTLVLWLIHPWFAVLAATLIALAAAIRLTSQITGASRRSSLRAAKDYEACAMRDAQKVSAHPALSGLSQNLFQRFFAAQKNRSDLQDQMTPGRVATIGLEAYLRSLTQLLGLSLGAALVVGDALSAGGMIAASLILTKTVASFEAVFASIQELKHARQSMISLRQLPVCPRQTNTEIDGLEGALKCEGLISPRGGGAPPRLDRISFALSPGSCLAIVGASGSGKSTLLEALAGVTPCPIGTVWLDETAVDTLPPDSQTAQIGYLPQQAQLFHGTLADNICGFATMPNDKRVIAAAQTAGVHGLISALPQSYDTDVGASPFVLSAGQKQRVALARAIFHQPRYLFLDEPNALLDAAGERQLCAVLARLKKQRTTIVMVIHRSGLMGLADHVLALDKGRLADFGPRSDVLGRMSGGRRRLEVPILSASLQDVTDWVGAQFSRSNDAALSQRAELIASELFNLALVDGPRDTQRTAVFLFRFLNDHRCEISLTENRTTHADKTVQRVARLMRQPEANMSDLPRDEAAIAMLSQLSENFDVQNLDGQSVYRAALSTSVKPLNGMTAH